MSRWNVDFKSDMANETMNEKKRRIGIKWKMYAILIIFIGIVVGVILFLQVQLLNYFYQITKFNELELSAAAISAELGNKETIKDVTESYASDYYTDIWIYRVTDEAHLILQVKGTSEPNVQFSKSKFSRLYDKAVENGGLYIAMLPRESFRSDIELKILKDNNGDSKSYPIIVHNSTHVSAVYVGIKNVNGQEYMIVQSTVLTPYQAMVKTLQNQSIWIAFILSVLALIMAAIMSKLITKPIVKMNEAAKKLAKGDYNADFEGKGYREIEELSDTLKYASLELAKTDNLQKELISNISHDLRTPLTMIKGYSEVMRDIPGENTPENIQIIIDETSRLSDLVNDMLDLSRIQSGTRKPELQLFSLTETVRDTMQRYKRLTMQDGYRIEFEENSDAHVIADRGMILQVVYNLINNAINYTGEDKYVCVKQNISGGKVRISVEDTGAGIAEDQISMIWDRYYKVDKVHRRATIGTGLGLSIVKGILELHGAAYGVSSKEGIGSIFWFELNIVEMKRNDTQEPSLYDYIDADYENVGIEKNKNKDNIDNV